FPGPRALVVVPANRPDRRDSAELGQHLRSANITAMNDQLAAGQKLNGLRPYQTVGIGYQPNARGGVQNATHALTLTRSTDSWANRVLYSEITPASSTSSASSSGC